VDAAKIATDAGLGAARINMIMQAAFYQLSKVILPKEKAIDLLKEDIRKTYAHKGPKVINMNINAVDKALDGLIHVNVNPEWKYLEDDKETRNDQLRKGILGDIPDSVRNIMDPLVKLELKNSPVSTFQPGGGFETGTCE
jgi:pyruvate-ferredoxin/flavodoxin oxidoreductase